MKKYNIFIGICYFLLLLSCILFVRSYFVETEPKFIRIGKWAVHSAAIAVVVYISYRKRKEQK